MANLNNLQGSLNWCGSFLKFQPLAIGGNEPALTSANIVLQTILGPPFCWRWNRTQVNFTCIATPVTQDYVVAVSDFGFLEKVWIKSPTATDIKELQVRTSLSLTLEAARSQFLAAQADDNNGNITFRLSAAPDLAYVATVLYQKKPPLFTSLANTWAPVPDEYSYIYNWGLLALLSLLLNDARFPIFNQKFIAHLLGAADGLDDMQRNIFLGNWLEVTKSFDRAKLNSSQGINARGQA